MTKRGGRNRSLPADFDLWTDVAETVSPLKPRRRIRPQVLGAALPLPPSSAPLPVWHPPRSIAMPSYQSAQTPGKPPAGVIEPRLRRRLGRGHVPIEGTLDLHGMTREQARGALARFLTARASRGDRTVLVITGKGLATLRDDRTTIIERGVLRTMLPIWLNSPELSPLVAGWDQSAQQHGGEGAWYVRLRRQPR